jgi:hypothetical protein
MIINKDTSDAVLVQSFRAFDSGLKPFKKVKEFDTDTLQVTDSSDATHTAADYGFFITFEDVDAVEALLDASLYDRIVPGNKRGHGGATSMVYEVADPDHYHRVVDKVSAQLVQCTNCATYFIIYVAPNGEAYATERVNASDKYLTAVEIADPDNYACDQCSTDVSLLFG